MQLDSALELTARLNARSSTWNVIGGLPQYTASDIATAIGLMRYEVDRLFIRVMYAGQSQFRKKLEKFIKKNLSLHSDDRRKLKKITPQKLIATVLLECTHQSLCLSCRGEGWKIGEMGQHSICQDCSGSGYKPFSDNTRAKLLGLHHEILRRKYKILYERTLDCVRAIAERAGTELVRCLE